MSSPRTTTRVRQALALGAAVATASLGFVAVALVSAMYGVLGNTKDSM